MRVHASPRRTAGSMAIAALMAVSLAVQLVRDRAGVYPAASGVMWIRSGPLAQRPRSVSITLVADGGYWMRAVIYYGGQRRTTLAKNFDQLFPLLDLVTSPRSALRGGVSLDDLPAEQPWATGPARSSRAAAARASSQPRRGGNTLISASFITGGCMITRAAEWFKQAGAIPGALHWSRRWPPRRSPKAATVVAPALDRVARQHRY